MIVLERERENLREQKSTAPVRTSMPEGKKKVSLEQFIRKVPFTTPNQLCGDVQKMFSQHEDSECIVVCSDGMQPKGLLMRNRFYMNISKRYGVELFYEKPASTLMDASPLIVDIHVPPAS
ncbi:hypothetical protein [Paenibacillus protaetiae]|uniref:CBS domain-containing protein n=1 Tax=Paenibacillus protaetiae TaxID=2509456 RepID=A0A4V0YF60_9BACL|nr:hypothetical protein [Paenibacillus protaetiae]QAY66581.1 hypothetical protein ET464_09360 [Paenibacillus protaetiae]